MNTSTRTAREKYEHAKAMLTIAEAAWDGGNGDLPYSIVQKWQLEEALWRKVIEHAEEKPNGKNIER